MPLPRKLLNDDEELLAEMHPHWVFYAGPLAAAAAAWVVVIIILISFHHIPSWTSYPLLLLAAVPTVWFLARLVRWRLYTLALTSTRILVRKGVLDRDTVQLRLQRITEINLAQTLWERALGTGRLVIDVQGEDDSLVLEDVRKPAIVQRVVNSQINELTGGGSREQAPSDMVPDDWRPRHSRQHEPDTPPFGTPAVDPTEPCPTPTPTSPWSNEDPHEPTPSPPVSATQASVHEKLIELDDLRRRGILTDEEFQAKKAQLLDRI
jgi:membrane protein YdbS with pleckstrin-like domain